MIIKVKSVLNCKTKNTKEGYDPELHWVIQFQF